MPMEVQMVPKSGEDMRAFMARCALAYDTAMSRAMLRALGIPSPRRTAAGGTVQADTLTRGMYEGVSECMGQRFGVRL